MDTDVTTVEFTQAVPEQERVMNYVEMLASGCTTALLGRRQLQRTVSIRRTIYYNIISVLAMR